MEIIVGSLVIGKSGRGLVVDRIEGKILHCGKLEIPSSAVVKVLTPLAARLENLSTLEKPDAIAELNTLASEVGEDSIYKASFALESVFLGTFVRRCLQDIGK